MRVMPRIRSVMTPFPYSLGPGDSLAAARRLMSEHAIRHLPVMRGGRPAGVITDQDLRRAEAVAGADADLRVGDLALTESCMVDLSAPLDLVLLDMARRHLDSALVLKAGKLVGIFTATDACRAFAEFLRREAPAPGGGPAAARPEVTEFGTIGAREFRGLSAAEPAGGGRPAGSSPRKPVCQGALSARGPPPARRGTGVAPASRVS
jgi:acetoin utilization protein AcuB